jgi:hypothetical protein
VVTEVLDVTSGAVLAALEWTLPVADHRVRSWSGRACATCRPAFAAPHAALTARADTTCATPVCELVCEWGRESQRPHHKGTFAEPAAGS